MNNKDPNRVRYPIGAKLVIIISVILLVSLGSITVLSTWLITGDIRVAAESQNYEINHLAASQTEEILSQMRINTGVLFNIIDTAGRDTRLAEQCASWFFDGHREIAAAAVFDRESFLPSALLLNERFFFENGIDINQVQAYISGENAVLRRAGNGEALFRSAAPLFGFPAIAFFYPHAQKAAFILFSADLLSDNYGSGANSSYLIDDEAGILVHPNIDLVMAGVNAGNDPFVRSMRENPQASMQTVFYDDDQTRYFGAFSKLSMGNAAVITTVEYDRVFEGVAATTRRNVYLTVLVLLLAGILIWLFSKTISIPMKALTLAARQIEGGEFEITLTPKTKDELGVLTGSFSRMSKALGIFGRFTNREIAVRAMRGEIKPGGLPRQGTIFFSDIRGFTEKSENFTKQYGGGASDRIVHWLNEYFTRMVECVEETNGVIDKFIGDAVMAHWGTAYSAGSPEKDAFNCIKAALMMRSALLEMNNKRRGDDSYNPAIRIGCGINSGVVTAGQIGSERRMEYTVIGDPVNLASRTEALNKPLGTDILITETTWNLAGKYFITEEMPSVRVKGKSAPVRLFAVIQMRGKEKAHGPRTLAELRSLLGIETPRLDGVNMDAEEKYRIGG
jgi:adenylate cyclase